MERVLIVGPGGAGKSWLAKRIAARTGLPLVHLDREFWNPGWVETAKPVWRARVKELAAGERWVMDGNYGGTLAQRMERADTIIFLDVSRWTSLAGVLRRRFLARHRDDIAEGCPERLDLTFLKWLWAYHDHHRPAVLAQLGDHADGRRIIRAYGPRLRSPGSPRASGETPGSRVEGRASFAPYMVIEERRLAVPSLLARVGAGDAAAVREVVSRYGNLVWSIARRFEAADAEDAVQEIFSICGRARVASIPRSRPRPRSSRRSRAAA